MIEKAVPTPLSVDAGTTSDAMLKANWGLGNQLYVSHVCKPPRQGDEGKKGEKEEEGGGMFKVQWNLDMQHKHMRQLVCQSRMIFLQVEKQCADQSTLLNKQVTHKLLHSSQQYRVAIKTCTAAMQDNAEALHMSELVWSLCEMLFLSNQQETGVVTELLSWCRTRFHDNNMFQEVLKQQQPHLHPQYWDLVNTLVLQGSMEEAAELLKSQPEQHHALQALIFLITSMPLYAPESSSEWCLKRQQWRQVCQEHLSTLLPHPPLHTLCRILSGEDEVFGQLLHLLPSWYCLLASQLFFIHPATPPSDLRLYAPACLERYGVQGERTEWDEVLLCVLKLDLKQAIAACCKNFGNWWFSAHLTHLLHHASCLPRPTLNYGSDLREYLLLDYATSLLSSPCLLETAFDYLSCCPVYGRSRMQEVLQRLPFSSDASTHKLLALCRKHHLHASGTQVAKRQGIEALRQGRFSSALKWCVLTQDAALAVDLVNKVLQRLPLQQLHHLDILNHLPHTLTFSDHLIFLGKLQERAQDDTLVLISLLHQETTTRPHWPLMLQTLLQTLQQHKPTLDRQQCLKVLECLDEIEADNTYKHIHTDMHTDTKEDATTYRDLRVYMAHSLSSSCLE